MATVQSFAQSASISIEPEQRTHQVPNQGAASSAYDKIIDDRQMQQQKGRQRSKIDDTAQAIEMTREDKARDSGCLIHSNGKDGGYEGCWMPSIEVQIIEGGVGGNAIAFARTCQHGTSPLFRTTFSISHPKFSRSSPAWP